MAQVLESTSGCFLIFRAENLFHSFKPLGGPGAFLLVPEVSSFHSSPSPEAALAVMLEMEGIWSSAKDQIPVRLIFSGMYCSFCKLALHEFYTSAAPLVTCLAL